MKIPKKAKLNLKGFSHVELLVAILVVVAIAAIGVRVLTSSHAVSPKSTWSAYVALPKNNATVSGSSVLIDIGLNNTPKKDNGTITDYAVGPSNNTITIGQPIPTGYGYLKDWDTTLLVNGQYEIYATYQWRKTTITSPEITVTVSNGVSSSAPSIPTTGAYLGAWVNSSQLTGSGTGNALEISKLPAFNATIGKSVAILHSWIGFSTAFPTTTVDAIAQNGSIPMINWGCTNVSSISSGAEDATINSFADAAKAYGKPIFLRWYWEMNQINSDGSQPAGSNCGGYNNGPAFVAAWQHIYSLFKADGASNVSFVWCPGYSGGNFSTYYPGDNYVDWIGIDRYQRTSDGGSLLDFSSMFSGYYDEWASHNKPIMVAETAAMGSSDQSQYLTSILNQAPDYPDIKAVLYFDAVGPAGDWSLEGSGVTAYKSLANSQYFSYKDN